MPEPPRASNLEYVPQEGIQISLLTGQLKLEISVSINTYIISNLVFLSDFTQYSPDLPTTIKIHSGFGSSHILIVDGFVSDTVDSLPTISITDIAGLAVLEVKLEPSYSKLLVKSSQVRKRLCWSFLGLILSFDSHNIKIET